MKKLPFVIVLIYYWLCTSPSLAQQVKAFAQIDSSKILIGDQLPVHLTLAAKKGLKINWPAFKDSLGKLDIISRGKIDTTEDGNNQAVIYKQSVVVSAFDTGTFVIPPVAFTYTISNDTALYQALTNALDVHVFAPKVDTTQAIRDIKGPLDIPFTWKEALPYIIGLVVLIVILIIGYRYWKRLKQRPQPVAPPAPPRPIHELALEQLQLIESEKLWQAGQYKLYHTKLTDVVRSYLFARFGINAMELTSDEILTQMRSFQLDMELKTKLQQLLVLADLVKFAKTTPIHTENELSMKNAIDFIQSTAVYGTATTPTNPQE